MDTTFAPDVRMHHATRAKATRLSEMLAAEYPCLSLEVVTGDPSDHPDYDCELGGFEILVSAEGSEHDGDVVWDGEKVPELADVIDACSEVGFDPSATYGEEEEEEAPSGNIIPEKYRQGYREASTTGQCNGDWLAERLASDTLDGNLKLDMGGLIRVFENNGLDMSAKWAAARFSQTRGWQGRFRMSGRAVLEKAVALAGVYVGPDRQTHTPDGDWMDDMERKHGKWLAKQRKVRAELDASMKP